MKFKHAIVVLLLSQTSCSLMNRSLKTTSKESIEENNQVNTNAFSTDVKSREQMQLETDSTDADYEAYFWPKGQLNLSPKGGFAGEFDSVIVRWKSKQISKNYGSSREEEVASRLSNTLVKQDRKDNSANKKVEKKGTPALKIVGLGLIFGLVIFFIAKMRKFFS